MNKKSSFLSLAKKGLSFCVLFLFLFVAACKKSDPVTPGTSSVIMPLTTGTQWTYRESFFDSVGAVLFVDTATFVISRDTTIANEKWHFIDELELLTNRSDGLWYIRLFFAPEGPVLFAKYPGNVNDSWLGPDTTTATIASVNASSTVPAGTYTCYQYTYARPKPSAQVRFTYFSVGTGIVKDEFRDSTTSGLKYIEARRELIAFSLKKSPASSFRREKPQLFPYEHDR